MNIQNVLRDNTWAVVFGAIVISFIIPSIGIGIKPLIGYLLMMLMYLSCLDISGKQIIEQIVNWKRIVLIILIIHLLSPIIIFLIKPFLSDAMYVGLILTASMPAGMSVVFLSCMYCDPVKKGGKVRKFFSNMFYWLAPQNSAVASKALVITTISHVLAPLIVPLIVLLFTSTVININVWPIGLMIVKFVIIPIVFAKFFTSIGMKKRMKKYSSSVSLLLLFVIMLGVISPLRDTIIQNWQLSIYIAFIVLCLLTVNFFAGYFLGRNKEEKITFGISANYKNFTLASVIALSVFTPLAAMPAIIYAVMYNFFLVPLQLVLLRFKKK